MSQYFRLLFPFLLRPYVGGNLRRGGALSFFFFCLLAPELFIHATSSLVFRCLDINFYWFVLAINGDR